MKRLKKYLIDYNIEVLTSKPALDTSQRRMLLLLLLAKIGKPLA